MKLLTVLTSPNPLVVVMIEPDILTSCKIRPEDLFTTQGSLHFIGPSYTGPNSANQEY